MTNARFSRRMVLTALVIGAVDAACRGRICRSQTPRGNTVATEPPPLRWSLSERERFRKSKQTATRLRAASERSLHRGLLPLVDMVRQQQAAGEVELRLAALTGDAAARLSTLESNAAVLTRSAAHLREFRQPAAEHWGAELALAELLSARAQAELARARGDLQAARAAESSIPLHARELFRWRVFDDKLGIAGLAEAALATGELITSDPAVSGKDNSHLRTAMTEYRTQLERHVQQTERWRQAGAGIGRSDRAALAGFQLAQLDVLLASERIDGGDAENRSSLRTALQTADACAAEMFAEQWSFYQTGTASLADLTQAWMLRDQVHRGAETYGADMETASITEQADNFQQLRRAADRTIDLRGRHEADVLLVRVLSDIAEWRSLERSISARAAKAVNVPAEEGDGGPPGDSSASTGAPPGGEKLDGDQLLRRYYPPRILDFTSSEAIGGQ